MHNNKLFATYLEFCKFIIAFTIASTQSIAVIAYNPSE